MSVCKQSSSHFPEFLQASAVSRFALSAQVLVILEAGKLTYKRASDRALTICDWPMVLGPNDNLVCVKHWLR